MVRGTDGGLDGWMDRLWLESKGGFLGTFHLGDNQSLTRPS